MSRADEPPEGGRLRSPRRRNVSAEEADLWRHVTRSIEPLGERPSRDRSALPTATDRPVTASEADRLKAPPGGAVPGRSAVTHVGHPSTSKAGDGPGSSQRGSDQPLPRRPRPKPTPPPAAPVAGSLPPRGTPASRPTDRLPSPPPAPPSLDRRAARRIAAGATTIDARIDLHGLFQDEAHARLRSFIRSCHARGVRTALVITGKGGPSPGRDGRDRPLDLWSPPSERGVLKRNVPRWLAEPGLADLIVSVGPAAIAHGGEGALYVVLRRKPRPGGG